MAGRTAKANAANCGQTAVGSQGSLGSARFRWLFLQRGRTLAMPSLNSENEKPTRRRSRPGLKSGPEFAPQIEVLYFVSPRFRERPEGRNLIISNWLFTCPPFPTRSLYRALSTTPYPTPSLTPFAHALCNMSEIQRNSAVPRPVPCPPVN